MNKLIVKLATLAALSADRLRAILGLVLATALISAGLFTQVRASADDEILLAAGDLDPSFGAAGKVTTDFGVPAQVNTMLIQSDGKLIVAGFVQLPTGNDFGLARYNPNGSLDTSFGDGGSVATDFSGGDDRALAMALQPDGKIVVAGTATTPSGGFDFALARYKSNGTLDPSFGSGGKVTSDFSARDDRILAIVVLPDGRIVAGGSATNGAGVVSGAFALYNPDGSLIVKDSDDPADFVSISAASIQPDGKLVGAGSTIEGQGPRHDFRLDRSLANLEDDTGFGDQGQVTTDFGGNDDAFALALPSNGKLVVAGSSGLAGVTEFAVARYNNNGSLDSSFGSGGKVRTSSLGSAGKPAFANAVVVQSDNKIVAVGFSTPGAAGSDFTLLRFNVDGSLDPTFGSGGKLTTDFFGGDDAVRAALIQPDGKIVVAGFASQGPGGSRRVAIARYLSGIGPDFSIGFDQPSVTAERGTKARVTVIITRTGGFTGNVTVTPPDRAGGIKPKPNAPMTTSDSSVVYKMKIGAGADTGPHDFLFTAKDDAGTTRTATITIVVQ